MQIYVHRDNRQLGPFTEAELKAQLSSGAISLQDHVWWDGQANWIPLGQSSLAATLSLATPPVPKPGMPAVPGTHSVVPVTSQLAIWALVCGCLSLLCSLFTSIPAIILGHLALVEIKKNPSLQGRGMALAGLIIGYVMTLLVLVIYITIMPAILKAVKDAQAQGQISPAIPPSN